jgi:methylated-DNA-protein-cysteine methyltransferase-like protein
MSDLVDPSFKDRVEAIVSQIPYGRVMTYGQLAALCGNARAARIVGGIAHFGDPNLPWQRVVNKTGGLAAGYPGGRRAHAEQLATEGIQVSEDFSVSVRELLWWPPGNEPRQGELF